MRLTTDGTSDKTPRIAISQAEITADLLYPARRPAPEDGGRKRGGVDERRRGAPSSGEAFAAPAPRQPQPHAGLAGPGADRGRGREMTGMEYMRAIVAGEVPPPPIAVTMRMRPIELEEGRAVFEGEPGEEHYNPIGVVHGGYAATLLDSALGCAVHTTLPAGVGYTSLGLEAKYVRPITRDTGRVLCEANVLYRGRRQATSEANLTAAESGKLLAHGAPPA